MSAMSADKTFVGPTCQGNFCPFDLTADTMKRLPTVGINKQAHRKGLQWLATICRQTAINVLDDLSEIGRQVGSTIILSTDRSATCRPTNQLDSSGDKRLALSFAPAAFYYSFIALVTTI